MALKRSRPHKVLVILDNCHEADALRLLFCLDAIRSGYASSHITLLVNERASAVFQRIHPFDRMVTSRLYQERTSAGMPLRTRKLRELVRLMSCVGAGYDLSVTLGVGSSLLNVLARLVAQRSIGFRNRYPWLMSLDLGRYDPYGDPRAQHVKLLSASGLDVIEPSVVTIRTAGDDADAAALLGRNAIDSGTAFVVLHPGSDWACQQWLAERWAIFADALIEEHAVRVVFTGVAAEASYIAGIQRRMRFPSTSLAGLTSLPRLEAVIARARLCVCVDSAVYDLSLRTATPVVVLAGPSDADRPSSGRSQPIIVNMTPPDLRERINACKEPKDIFGGCLNYDCPMAGLRNISVAAMMKAVAGVLAPKSPAAIF